MSHLSLIGSLVLSCVFAASAAGKCRSSRAFSEFLDGVTLFTGFTGRRARALGALVVAAEWAIVLLCPAPAAGPAGGLLAAATLTAFVVGIGRVLARGDTGSCHCFTTGHGDIGPRHLVRNGLLIALAIAAAAGRSGSGRTWVQAGLPLPEIALDLVVTLVLVGVVLVWDDLASLFSVRKPLS